MARKPAKRAPSPDDPAGDDQCRRIRERGAELLREQPLLEKLREKLLEHGGKEVVFRKEPHLDFILSRGSFQPGSKATSMPGEPGDCHGNSARLWLGDPDGRQLWVGYALSADQLWRQHSWVTRDGEIGETTEPRTDYFGAPLSPADAGRFAASNIPELGSFLDFMTRNKWFTE